MYHDAVFRVSVLDDSSFLVRMTIEKDQKGKDWPKTIEKEVSAKTTEEVKALLEEYLPVLSKRDSQSKEFDDAFAEATKANAGGAT